MASSSALIGIGKRLKAAREASGRSVDDLVAATRINKAFIEDLENGREPKVPEIYLRAFVKTIATDLGTDPAELLEMLKEQAPAAVPEPPVPGERTHAKSAPPERRSAPRPAPAEPSDERKSSAEAVRRQAKILVGLALLVVVGLVMSVYWLRNERNEKGVQEISFSEVVKEQTAKLQSADSSADSSLAAAPAASSAAPAALTHPSAKGDTLRLQAVTSESVWVHISLDGATPMEYTLPPGFHLDWAAAKEFSLSLGNPGGISFTLNGKHLGKLGEGKRPVKNVVLNHASLDRR